MNERVKLETHPEGLTFVVKANPAARQNGLQGIHQGMLKVSVTQVPEKGKANKAILQVLSKSLRLRKSQLELLSGQTASEKRFLVRELDANTLQEKLQSALAPS
ncbi:DUF167 domain-containing protein [Planctomycetales bacterium 10988]|nr:DUF167 domain-containing protein [Planctomycetales bacterium 10988]